MGLKCTEFTEQTQPNFSVNCHPWKYPKYSVFPALSLNNIFCDYSANVLKTKLSEKKISAGKPGVELMTAIKITVVKTKFIVAKYD